MKVNVILNRELKSARRLTIDLALIIVLTNSLNYVLINVVVPSFIKYFVQSFSSRVAKSSI